MWRCTTTNEAAKSVETGIDEGQEGIHHQMDAVQVPLTASRPRCRVRGPSRTRGQAERAPFPPTARKLCGCNATSSGDQCITLILCHGNSPMFDQGKLRPVMHSGYVTVKCRSRMTSFFLRCCKRQAWNRRWDWSLPCEPCLSLRQGAIDEGAAHAQSWKEGRRHK